MSNPAKNSESTQQNVATKTYLTTDQFIKVFKSLSDEKSRELDAARVKAWSAILDAARYAAWYATRSVALDAARVGSWHAAESAARYATRYATRYADLAVLAKDKITAEQFEVLTSPWTSCGLSLYAEDWEEELK